MDSGRRKGEGGEEGEERRGATQDAVSELQMDISKDRVCLCVCELFEHLNSTRIYSYTRLGVCSVMGSTRVTCLMSAAAADSEHTKRYTNNIQQIKHRTMLGYTI
jgi:hypothetical protein